jgi:hypothetical protein
MKYCKKKFRRIRNSNFSFSIWRKYNTCYSSNRIMEWNKLDFCNPTGLANSKTISLAGTGHSNSST